jgi:hypothetical protein
LFAVIGTSSGHGNGSTTFNLPDLRGRFLRGVDGATGRDPDSASRTAPATGGNSGSQVGSVQNQSMIGHTHQAGVLRAAVYLVPGGLHTLEVSTGFTGNKSLGTGSGGTGGGGSVPASAAVLGTSGNLSSNDPTPGAMETRPVNVYVNYIIKH